MKKINKIEPDFYTEFLRKNKPKNWQDIETIRSDIRTYILSGLTPNAEYEAEQNFQCAYTEVALEDSDFSHIDHFKKKNLFPKLIFDWSNLVVAANDEDLGAKHKDNKYKVKPIDYELLINQAEENPMDYFTYSFTGEILIKSEDKASLAYKKAKLTIDVFNLQLYRLVKERQVVAEYVKYYFDQNISDIDIKKNIGKFDALVDDLIRKLRNIIV